MVTGCKLMRRLSVRRSSAAGNRSDSDSDEMPQQRSKDEVAALMIHGQFGRSGRSKKTDPVAPGTPSKSKNKNAREMKRGW